MKSIISICTLLLLSLQIIKAQDSLIYSKMQVAEDISYFFKNAEEIHPNLYHSISNLQLNKKIDLLVNTLPDSLSKLMAYRALAVATAYINEGHTGVNLPSEIRNKISLGFFQSIPLQVTNYANKVFYANIVATNSTINNIRVVAINSQSSNKIFNQIIALKGGLPSFKQISAIKYFRFYLTAIGITQPYQIQYLDSKSNKATTIVNSISESNYMATVLKPVDITPYTFTIKNNIYGYLNFKSMKDYDGFVKFCDSVFNVLSIRNIKELVVDLRENGGGNSSLGKYLLDYITNKPYRMAGESERKVSQQFKNQIVQNKNLYGGNYDDYLKTSKGSIFKIGLEKPNEPENKPNKFKGKVCFLIGSYTFSSANMLAATIKDYKLATLIGEPTGEPGNDYGELCDVRLPQTGFVAFTSTTMWVRPDNDKTNENPIIPDYVVKNLPNEKDDVLQYAIKWLNN